MGRPPLTGRPGLARRAGRVAVAVGAVGAATATVHTAYNLTRLRVPPTRPDPVMERVSVLLPVRDEAHRVEPCLRSLLAQRDVDDLEILVLDDCSTDATADVVRRVAGGDARVQLLNGKPPPAGWLGKPYACHQLSERATGSVLVFIDADVVLARNAVAATVALLRASRLDLISPYPRQLCDTPSERLIQPLLQWSWLTTLPLGVAERSSRAALAAANGQLLAVDADVYRRAGGHEAVRSEVLDDIALLRAILRIGGHGGMADGTSIATCRMYDGWDDLRAGYDKSLWSAFGSRAGAAGVVAALSVLYVVPAAAALRGSKVGFLGYTAGVAGRAMVARRVGGRTWPDSLAHPASIGCFGWLVADSWGKRRRDELTWKGRRV